MLSKWDNSCSLKSYAFNNIPKGISCFMKGIVAYNILVFDNLTRGGNPIVKTYNGDFEALLNDSNTPPITVTEEWLWKIVLYLLF